MLGFGIRSIYSTIRPIVDPSLPKGEIVQGKVKWFSQEKGYGYIIADDDGKEHYFNIRDVVGAKLPRNSDVVSFQIEQGKKGPKATSVSIQVASSLATTSQSIDERVTCSNCGKKMVPRIIIYRGSPSKSVCPYCAATYKDFGWCFIATAVYKDYHAPEVMVLRRFRDETLQSSHLGRIFINAYYRASPPIARFVSRRPLLSSAFRFSLDIVVRWLA